MQSKVTEIDGYLICSQHNKKIRMIVIDQSTLFLDSFLCEQCIDSWFKIQSKMISLEVALEEIQSKNPDFNINQVGGQLELLKHFWSQAKQLLDQLQIQNNEKNRSLTEKQNIIEQKLKTENDQQNKITLKQVNTTKQNEYSYALAFNNTGSIMVAGCDNDIKVWKFDQGKMEEMNQLLGHKAYVYCLVFSKNSNWFASGSGDQSIRGWKEEHNNQWISTEPQQKHQNYVIQLILNKNEDQLISCSCDSNIKVWKINCKSNRIKFEYTLEKKQVGVVFSISLNEQETSLVSISGDQKIALWFKGKNEKWEYQNHIIMDDIAYRMCFISDNQIALQQCNRGFTKIFEIIEGKLKELDELEISLEKGENDQFFFPTIFNKSKQLIIQKHSYFIYIIRKQNDGKFKIEQTIEYDNQVNQGALTADGEYLVAWIYDTKSFNVYKID